MNGLLLFKHFVKQECGIKLILMILKEILSVLPPPFRLMKKIDVLGITVERQSSKQSFGY